MMETDKTVKKKMKEGVKHANYEENVARYPNPNLILMFVPNINFSTQLILSVKTFLP